MLDRIRLPVISCLILCLAALPAQAFETKAKQAIVVDYDTGSILLTKDADQRMPTSSMSKVMTMYVIFKAIHDGQLKWDQELPVSKEARYGPDGGWADEGSRMYVEIDSKVKVSDLARGVIIQSGNDATVVLAEGLAGTEASFAELMNKEAAHLGMKGSHFVNASGWPDPNHYSTAKDLAILAWNLIHQYPEEYKLYSEKEFTFNNIKQGNRNPLVQKGVGDGVKTGHTTEAGYGLIGSGVGTDGRRVIFVVNGYETMNDRYSETPQLLDWALKNFANLKLFEKGKPLTEASVVFGKEGKVPLTVTDDLVLTVPRFDTGKVKIEAKFKSPLVAPLKAGAEVGQVVITMPNLPPRTLPLVAANDVEEQNLFARAIAKAMIKFVGL
jgi:D-alanyl-D-alanine carboxypeptidase (penicillin-binding protein 5/6)